MRRSLKLWRMRSEALSEAPRVAEGEAMTENERLREELAKMTRERDAYRRAKQENDERFMIERDEAREEARSLARENDLLRAELAALGCGDE